MAKNDPMDDTRYRKPSTVNVNSFMVQPEKPPSKRWKNILTPHNHVLISTTHYR